MRPETIAELKDRLRRVRTTNPKIDSITVETPTLDYVFEALDHYVAEATKPRDHEQGIVLLEAQLEIEREKKTPDCRTEFEHASDLSQITNLLRQLTDAERRLRASETMRRNTNTRTLDGLKRIAKAIGDDEPFDLDAVHILASLIEHQGRRLREAEGRAEVIRRWITDTVLAPDHDTSYRIGVLLGLWPRNDDGDNVLDAFSQPTGAEKK